MKSTLVTLYVVEYRIYDNRRELYRTGQYFEEMDKILNQLRDKHRDMEFTLLAEVDA